MAEKVWKLQSGRGGDFDYDKLPTQKEFVFDFEHPCQMYGGGVGNGKTAGALAKCFLLSYLAPGNTGLIARWDGKELRQTTMAEWGRMVPSWMFQTHNTQMGYMKFKPQYGGSEIFYGDLKETRAINNYNLGWVYVDQCEEIDDERWNLLLTRTRKKVPLLWQGEPIKHPQTGEELYAPNYNFGTFNPEGTSSYIWRYFHPDSPERKPGYQLYQATSYDGMAAGFVTKEYIDRLLAVFPEQARKRYLEGAWDVFQGRVYPTFSVETHVIPSCPVKPHWKLYESIDHGLQNPTAVGWWAIDEHGNCFLVDEHYEGGGKPVSYHAQIIKAKRAALNHPIAVTYLDAHCWARDQSKGEHVYSIADEYRDHGIYAIPGQKDWNTAYNRINEHLTSDPTHRHPITGELGAPRLYVFEHCTCFIHEKLGYRWKKQRGTVNRNAPDEPIDYMDHHMDEEAYFFASRPQHPIIKIEVTKSPLEIWQAQRKSYNPLELEEVGAGSWMSV